MSTYPETMLAAVYRDGDLEVKRMPRPKPGRGEALLKIEAAALCATDIKIWQKGHRNINEGTEAILGHEVVGRVVQTGEGIDENLLGMRVVVPPNVGCGFCPACLRGWDSYCPAYKAYGVGLNGGLAEYMLLTSASISRGGLVEIPEHIPTKIAALAEPVSCCYRGLKDCELKAGETVLIAGTGPMGILAIMTARVMGAAKIIAADPVEGRREISKAFRADHVLDPARDSFKEELFALTGGWGIDVVMVTAPFSGAQLQGIDAAAIGGRINLFAGLAAGDTLNNFPSNLVHYRGLKVTGTTGTTPREMRLVVSLMAGNRLDQLRDAVTAVFPLMEAKKAFEEAKQGSGLKILLVPDGGAAV